MHKLNKAIAIMCLTAVMICIGYRIKARADEIPWAPEVLQNTGFGDMTGIGLAYTSLTSEQKTIAAYLIGAFNNMYLMARGFSYSIPENETAWKAQFIALGNKVWQYATTAYGWKSRFNEVFRQYLSSVCVYASSISTTFDAWYNANTGSGELYIPYSEEAFSAWTEFYNDPSGDGIATFGYSASDWDSGDLYDFAWNGYPWYSTDDENRYNAFILNYNPVLFTNTGTTGSNVYRQFVIHVNEIPDTLYILRSAGTYTQYRYGFSDFTSHSVGSTRNTITLTNQGKVMLDYPLSASFSLSTVSLAGSNNLNEFINIAFENTPFEFQVSGAYTFKPSNWYPYINHVYLVDNLNTFSNPEEVFNSTDLNIVAPDPVHEPYIIAPNDRLLFPTRPVGYDDPLGFWDIVIDNSVDENGDSVTEDDFHQQIINNTTINNYYVSNDDRINVPVEWFENDLTDQLANDSIPFLSFARDCIDTLGDLQIYLYGAVVFGLGGGILKKFLL